VLHSAREGNRLVIMTADHGHVLETGTSPLAGGESDRWRPEGLPVGPGERLFRGPRVMTATHTCVAATAEMVRYQSKKNGYHGGATAQEVVVPLGMFLPTDLTVPALREAALAQPSWWEPVVLETLPAPAPAIPVPTSRRTTPPLLQIAEQEPVAASGVRAVQQPASLFDALVSSAVFQSQRALHARLTLDEGRTKALLDYLVARGGRATRAAVAGHLGLAAFRLGGYLAALRTLLNVDAYSVLSVDDASDTIELNVDLLRTQFEL
jgi:hypothetical protein